MITTWGKNLDPEHILEEYPRPQLRRGSYINLNGLWDYAITEDENIPMLWDGHIIVPFSPECLLSGVNHILKSNEFLWYKRTVNIDKEFNNGRIFIHFGAVDQIATIFVNGHELTTHVGGYLPFSVEITDVISYSEPNTIIVKVTDDTDESWHTHGKQRMKRGGIWYTPQSGIWQTVWLESVPETYIKSLKITPDYDQSEINIDADIVGPDNTAARAVFEDREYMLPAKITINGFREWSPDDPYLYSFTVVCGKDKVESYFAMRKFSIDCDKKGVKRLFLNNRPYFQNGLLDQGYWPDGLYTAPSDEALIYDIKTAKAMGFNMLRKHIKVEPLRWYYHCDRLGMIVWQDMPSGSGVYNPLIISAPLITKVSLDDRLHLIHGRERKKGRKEFIHELSSMIKHLYNSPCIALWVPFNEGWGQFDAKKIYNIIQDIDSTRIIDHASGWHDQKIGDLQSLHVYFVKYKYKKDKLGRAVILSEYGGYNCSIPEHMFSTKEFGYKKSSSPDILGKNLNTLFKKQILPAKEEGLCAAVYTQLTDVEDELNGLMTYDREVIKLPLNTLKEIVDIR